MISVRIFSNFDPARYILMLLRPHSGSRRPGRSFSYHFTSSLRSVRAISLRCSSLNPKLGLRDSVHVFDACHVSYDYPQMNEMS